MVQAPTGAEVLAYGRDYDKENENLAEELLRKLRKNLNGYYAATGSKYITDPEAIEALTEVIGLMENLYIRYEDKADFDNISDYENQILGANCLPTLETLRHLKQMSDSFVRIMALAHGFKDRQKTKFPWEDIIKKKLHISPLSQNEVDYMNKVCRYRWQRTVFFWTHSCVVDNNDIHCLYTGINNSGKTNTDVCMMREGNKYFREFWHVEEEPGVPLHKFSMKKDVMYTPAPEAVTEYIGTRKFQTVAVTEGMGAAINLRSLNKQTIDMGIDAFRKRFQNCIVGYEYQVNKRPTALMMERYNNWIQKMGQRHMVLSLPNAYVNRADKFFFTELDDLRTDDEVNVWIRHKNPNYVTTMYAPKMGPRAQRRFDNFRNAAEESLKKARETKTTFKDIEYGLIREMYEQETNNNIVRIDIPNQLRENFDWDDKRITKFMKKYQDYIELLKIQKWQAKEVAQVGAAN